MPEDQNGQEEQILEGIQDVQGEETPEELSTLEEPTDAPVEGELPEDAKERTRREFEKLKEHNKQLAEENKKLKGQSQPFPSVLESYLAGPVTPVAPVYQQPVYQQPAPQPQPQALIDDQGYVNADVLQRQLEIAELASRKAEEAQERARQAEERITRFEIDNETRKLYESYPELDPASPDFNEEAYSLVKNELTGQIVNTGRRNALEAANKMSKYFRQQAPNPVLEQRKQAIQSVGVAQRPISTTDFEDLRRRSAHDPNALFERLQRLEGKN